MIVVVVRPIDIMIIGFLPIATLYAFLVWGLNHTPVKQRMVPALGSVTPRVKFFWEVGAKRSPTKKEQTGGERSS